MYPVIRQVMRCGLVLLRLYSRLEVHPALEDLTRTHCAVRAILCSKAFGKEHGDHLLASHAVLKERMSDLASTQPTDPTFDSKACVCDRGGSVATVSIHAVRWGCWGRSVPDLQSLEVVACAHHCAQVASVFKEFAVHSAEEEREEMPRLLQSPGVDEIELGKQFEAAAAHAVTRPHTWAPDK